MGRGGHRHDADQDDHLDDLLRYHRRQRVAGRLHDAHATPRLVLDLQHDRRGEHHAHLPSQPEDAAEAALAPEVLLGFLELRRDLVRCLVSVDKGRQDGELLGVHALFPVLERLTNLPEARASLLDRHAAAQRQDHADGLQRVLRQREMVVLQRLVALLGVGQGRLDVQARHGEQRRDRGVRAVREQGMARVHQRQHLLRAPRDVVEPYRIGMVGHDRSRERLVLAVEHAPLLERPVRADDLVEVGLRVLGERHLAQERHVDVPAQVVERAHLIAQQLAVPPDVGLARPRVLARAYERPQARGVLGIEPCGVAHGLEVLGEEVALCLQLCIHEESLLTPAGADTRRHMPMHAVTTRGAIVDHSGRRAPAHTPLASSPPVWYNLPHEKRAAEHTQG